MARRSNTQITAEYAKKIIKKLKGKKTKAGMQVVLEESCEVRGTLIVYYASVLLVLPPLSFIPALDRPPLTPRAQA